MRYQLDLESIHIELKVIDVVDNLVKSVLMLFIVDCQDISKQLRPGRYKVIGVTLAQMVASIGLVMPGRSTTSIVHP